MRLLNVTTFKLESFTNEQRLPPYLILSHRWEGDEVLFDDLHESPQDQEIQELRRSLHEMEQRFKRLESRLETGGERITHVQGDTPQQGISTSAAQITEDGEHGNANLLRSFPHLRRAMQKKSGWNKIYGCCKEAKALAFSYVWIDTCCINKDSSSELSEAINSMYAWYKNASVCIAYLSDVSFENMVEDFPKSEWFTRGWTLQELLAPDDVWFYSQDWQYLGLRSKLAAQIAKIASVNAIVLDKRGGAFIVDCTVAAILSWAARRKCSRAEDRSYSLLGLFGINMPTIYGEGERAAFFRLQLEIFKVTPDHSIFAWETRNTSRLWPADDNIFAPTVDYFQFSASIISIGETVQNLELLAYTRIKHSKFSNGIRVWLPVRPYCRERFQACLGCERLGSNKALTLFLDERGEGNFNRMDKFLVGIEFEELKGKEWFMKEVTICNPRTTRKTGPVYRQPVSIAPTVNDEQVLSSGFERIQCSSGFLTVTESAGMPLSSDESAFFGFLAGFSDLSLRGMPLVWQGPSAPMGTLIYFNKSTMVLFALIIMSPGDFWSSMTVVEPTSFRNIGSVSGGPIPISQTLTSGWHVWGQLRTSIVGTSYLTLTVKPVTPLGKLALFTDPAAPPNDRDISNQKRFYMI